MQHFENKELKNLIMHRFGSIAAFCEAAGITDAEQFAQDLERSDMSTQDIIKAAQALEIEPQEIGFYFFRPASDPNQSPDPCEVEGLEILNALGNAEHNFLLLKEPTREVFYIYLDGRKFATFDDEIHAVIIADMMQLHLKDYYHMLEG